MRRCSTPSTTTTTSPPLSFHSPSLALSFLFPLDAPLSTTAAPLSALLQTAPLCRWTYFTAPAQTQAHARSQTEAALLNGAAAREIRARPYYEKNWQISSKTAVLTREQGVQIKDAVCQVLGSHRLLRVIVWACCRCHGC